MSSEVSLIITISIGVFVGIVGFLLKYWFNKLNMSQDIIISDMKTLTEHKTSTGVKLESLKEHNDIRHKSMFKEISELSTSMNKSLEKLIIKTEKNSYDIANLKSEHRFIAKELIDIKNSKS